MTHGRSGSEMELLESKAYEDDRLLIGTFTSIIILFSFHMLFQGVLYFK